MSKTQRQKKVKFFGNEVDYGLPKATAGKLPKESVAKPKLSPSKPKNALKVVKTKPYKDLGAKMKAPKKLKVLNGL